MSQSEFNTTVLEVSDQLSLCRSEVLNLELVVLKGSWLKVNVKTTTIKLECPYSVAYPAELKVGGGFHLDSHILAL